jgi:hypothetical protein
MKMLINEKRHSSDSMELRIPAPRNAGECQFGVIAQRLR